MALAPGCRSQWAGQAGPVATSPSGVRCTHPGLCRQCSFLFRFTLPPCSCLLWEALSDPFSFWPAHSVCLPMRWSSLPQGGALRALKAQCKWKNRDGSPMPFPRGRAAVQSAPSRELGKGAPGEEAKGCRKCQPGLVSPAPSTHFWGFCMCQTWGLPQELLSE